MTTAIFKQAVAAASTKPKGALVSPDLFGELDMEKVISRKLATPSKTFQQKKPNDCSYGVTDELTILKCAGLQGLIKFPKSTGRNIGERT